jgi:hypothetical protein
MAAGAGSREIREAQAGVESMSSMVRWRQWARQGVRAGLVVSLAVMTGCNGEDRSVRSYSVPKSTTAVPQMGLSAASGGEFIWEAPAGWETGRSSSMRLASYSVPAKGVMADCSLIALGGSGGGLVANVNRWRGQIGLPPWGEAEVQGAAMMIEGKMGEMTYFRLENPDQPQSAMLVTMISGAGRTLFAKLSAPLANLDAAEPAFLEFCRSIGRAGTDGDAG